MTDSAQDFFDLIVDPAVLDFRAAEAELAQASLASEPLRLDQARANAMRRARMAVIELHQFADRVERERPPWAPGLSVDELRQRLMNTYCSRRPDDLLVLHDVADAFKHAWLKNPRKGRTWLVRSDRTVVTISTGWGELGWDEATWGGVEQVVVGLDDGSKRAISFVLNTVRDAWWSAMGRSN